MTLKNRRDKIIKGVGFMTNRELLEKIAVDVSDIKTEIVTINQRLDNHDKHFEQIDKRFEENDKRFNQRMRQIDRRFDKLDQKFMELFDFLNQDIRNVKRNLNRITTIN